VGRGSVVVIRDYIYNPSYFGGGGKRIVVPGHQAKTQTLSEKQTKSREDWGMVL
jgi:hypothetical protein